MALSVDGGSTRALASPYLRRYQNVRASMKEGAKELSFSRDAGPVSRSVFRYLVHAPPDHAPTPPPGHCLLTLLGPHTTTTIHHATTTLAATSTTHPRHHKPSHHQHISVPLDTGLLPAARALPPPDDAWQGAPALVDRALHPEDSAQ